MNIEHFAINHAEPAAWSAWYVAHLGLKIVRQLTESPFTHFLADGAGRVVVEVYCQKKAAIPDYGSFDPLVFHIAFVSTNVVKDRERLLAAGATGATEVTTTSAGDVMTFMHDPWGVGLQLIQRARPLL